MYVSKSSTALNPLTIMQLACEVHVGTRSQTVLCGPAHQLAVRMRIINSIIMVRSPKRYGKWYSATR